MKVVTSATVFKDSAGTRLSYTYSEVDGATGKILSDNNRENRIITDADAEAQAAGLLAYAQSSLEG